MGSATLAGADDDSEDGNSQPIDLSQLIVGQFVEVQLDASQLPALVATDLEVKNFANQVEVEVDDQSGNEVSDATNDVQVGVKETVLVQAPVAPGAAPNNVKKTVRLHTTSNGSFSLSGLPTGLAKITVRCGTSTAHKRVQIIGNTVNHVKVRLR